MLAKIYYSIPPNTTACLLCAQWSTLYKVHCFVSGQLHFLLHEVSHWYYLFWEHLMSTFFHKYCITSAANVSKFGDPSSDLELTGTRNRRHMGGTTPRFPSSLHYMNMEATGDWERDCFPVLNTTPNWGMTESWRSVSMILSSLASYMEQGRNWGLDVRGLTLDAAGAITTAPDRHWSKRQEVHFCSCNHPLSRTARYY